MEERRTLHSELSRSEKLTDEEKLIQTRFDGCFCKAIEIVNQVEQEYNNGWIPCSERLPEVNEFLLSEDVLVSFEDSKARIVAFYDDNNKKWCMYGSIPYFGEVVAWQPLPPKYEPKGE